jgi:hypothetical protein
MEQGLPFLSLQIVRQAAFDSPMRFLPLQEVR